MSEGDSTESTVKEAGALSPAAQAEPAPRVPDAPEPPSAAAPTRDGRLVPTLGRLLIRVLAVGYIAGIWLEGVGSELPARYVPAPAMYFLVVAALFPSKSTASSEFRAEGWVCAEDRWQEIDTRPYFPLDPDDKENRFQRAMHFYKDWPVVVSAVEAYLVDRHNHAWDNDGIPQDRPIGGVRLSIVREPIPRPGGPVKRYVRESLADIPKKHRHPFFETAGPELERRCGHPRGQGPAEEPPP